MRPFQCGVLLFLLFLFRWATSFSPSHQPRRSSGVVRRNQAEESPSTARSSSAASDPSKATTDELDIANHLRLLSKSLESATGKTLPEVMGIDISSTSTDAECWHDDVHMSMRYALLSHSAVNGLDGPINTYANFGAVAAFSYPRQQILQLPACRMALPGYDQEELTRIYLQLKDDPAINCIDDYRGFRCTQDQRQFFVRDAIVRTNLALCVLILRFSLARNFLLAINFLTFSTFNLACLLSLSLSTLAVELL